MNKNIWALALLSGPFLMLNAQNLSKTMLRLPDTGQTQDFTSTYGEDSDYSIQPPGFIVHTDGTVTDTVTGLMWQQTDGGEMTIESAETYCQNLNLGGYDDWRLPSAQEAFSIFNHGKQNPPLDLAVFQNTGAEYWWTGERQAGNAGKVWVTNAGGGIGNHPKTETISAGGSKKFHVRAVRDLTPPIPVPVQFIVSDSSVTDLLTGLEWQRFVSQDSMTWESALLRAENFVLEGKSDWRLPTVKELESLNDETRTQPSLNPDVFTNMGIKKLWASTSLPTQTVQAWFMETRFGVVSHDLKTAKSNMLLVRGPVGASTAVEETGAGGDDWIRIFPNPCSGGINLHFEPGRLGAIQSVSVRDAMGSVVFYCRQPSESALKINNLREGIYWLNIRSEMGNICRVALVL